MTLTLAIETGIEPEYERALQDAAKAEGWKVEVVQNVPFTDQFVKGDQLYHEPLPKDLLQNRAVWFHGSIQAAKRAHTATRWQVHAPWDDLRCQSYYPLLWERLLQRDHVFATLAEVRERRDELFSSELAEDNTLFIRPDGNDKTFTGGCLNKDDFEHGYALMTFYDPPPDTVVVVARPQRILSEARFLVVDGKLITGSFYKTGGQSVRLEAHARLRAVAQDHLAFCLDRGFNPAPSWILDLAETRNGWSIIEVGASSCCGLYKCDLVRFIEALTPVVRGALK